jgi:hypothetical protein
MLVVPERFAFLQAGFYFRASLVHRDLMWYVCDQNIFAKRELSARLELNENHTEREQRHLKLTSVGSLREGTLDSCLYMIRMCLFVNDGSLQTSRVSRRRSRPLLPELWLLVRHRLTAGLSAVHLDSLRECAIEGPAHHNEYWYSTHSWKCVYLAEGTHI